ncbi:MAG: hypothetical protein FJ297_15990 [Planctomycetes bacterium]|nr:hypothetical protein [Planctomycetota bacterium]
MMTRHERRAAIRTLFVMGIGAIVAAAHADRCRASGADDPGSFARSAPDLLPDTVVLYAEIPSPAALVARALNHPLRARLEASPDYQTALANPRLTAARAALTLFEIQVGGDWREILNAAVGGGIAVAVDGKTRGVVLVGRASDPAVLKKVRNAVIRMARQDAKQKGRPDPFQSTDYRGIEAHQAGNARFAVAGSWFAVTNQSELGKEIIDRVLDEERHSSSLAMSTRFQEGRALAGAEGDAWAFADIEAIRSAGEGTKRLEALNTQANPAAELILGGVLATLRKTPFASGSFALTDERAQLRLLAPHDASWIGEDREFFFGPGSGGAAPALIAVPNTIASLSAYRDISGMWLRAGDLFDQRTNDKLAEADSNLATLFSGRDFGEDILGALRPELQIVVARQDFTDREVTPAIRLPAFALVGELKEPETMQRELRRIFQSLIGFLNVLSAMNGQPQMDLGEETDGDRRIVTASFLPEVDRKKGEEGKIQFNFAPSLAFSGNRVILASTTPLAKQLAETLSRPLPPASDPSNTVIRADLRELRAILDENRRQLIAQNMLEKGQTREEAEKEMAGLFALLDAFQSVDVRLAVGPQLTLDMNVTYQTDAAKPSNE